MAEIAVIGAGVLVGLLSASITDIRKSYLNSILHPRKRIEKAVIELEEEIIKLNKTLSDIHIGADDRCFSPLQLPSKWLEELDKCRYDIQDVSERMEPIIHKKRVTKFLKTNIKNVKMIDRELRGRNSKQQGAGKTSYGRVLAEEFVRKEERKRIITELSDTSNSASIGVSITGIAGIGKTVLAEAVIVEAISKGHFSHVERVPHLSEELQPLDKKNEKILVLLDDMQNVVVGVWWRFRSAITKTNPGSKFIITTQNHQIADETGTTRHCLNPLTEEESFDIILRRANGNNNLDGEEADIHNNKEDLTNLCKGLPWLAEEIGLLLAAAPKGGRRDTIVKLGKSLWDAKGLVKFLINLRPVSLLRQEPGLNRCLAYCTLFPPDHVFERDNLVQFWMAEGFTESSSATEDTHDIAGRYFDLLLKFSLIQTSNVLSNEKPSYKLQELAYDLAQYVALSTFCRKHIDESASPSSLSSGIQDTIRHFSLSGDKILDDQKIVPQLLRSTKNICRGLRTFLLFGKAGRNISENPTFFHDLTFLRVLDLSSTNLIELTDNHISKLKYLRHLDLSFTPVKKLPKFSKNLKLQVLKLNCCSNVEWLPETITNLTSLVSLQVSSTKLTSMPPNMGKLSKLQTLDAFKVGPKEGYKIAELKNLIALRSLHICQLEKVETELEAQSAELLNKEELYRLELEWSRSEPGEIADQIFKCLKPPKNLKELIIRSYCPKFPEWLNGTELYGVFKTIHFDGCINLHMLPPLNHLKSLKNLIISGCVILTILSPLDCLISLEILEISGCTKLEELPPLNRLTSLKNLNISACTTLTQLPTLPAALNSLVIKDSAISRIQDNHTDWPNIQGVNVELDSQPVDAIVLPSVGADHHQSRSLQYDQRTESGDQITSAQTVTNPSQPLITGSTSSMSSDRLASKSSTRHYILNRFKCCFGSSSTE